MPTFQVDVKARRNGDIVKLGVSRGEQQLETILQFEEVNGEEKFATWLLAQTFPGEVDEPTLQRRFTISFHTEEVTDPETGQVSTVRVLDEVSSEPLP